MEFGGCDGGGWPRYPLEGLTEAPLCGGNDTHLLHPATLPPCHPATLPPCTLPPCHPAPCHPAPCHPAPCTLPPSPLLAPLHPHPHAVLEEGGDEAEPGEVRQDVLGAPRHLGQGYQPRLSTATTQPPGPPRPPPRPPPCRRSPLPWTASRTARWPWRWRRRGGGWAVMWSSTDDTPPVHRKQNSAAAAAGRVWFGEPRTPELLFVCCRQLVCL